MSIAAILVILVGLVVIFLLRIPVVLGLVVLIIAVYILQIISSPYNHPLAFSLVAENFWFFPYDLIDGRFYTVFTSMFLHASTIHLIFNIFALIFIGMMLENRIGKTRFIIIYLIAGIVGGLTWAAIHWGALAIAVGASGAIMGTLGAFARLFGKERIRMLLLFMPLPPMPAYVIFVVVLLIDLAIAFTSAPIAAEAHIGGAIAGFLIAPLVMKIPSRLRQPEPMRIHLSTLRQLATTSELRKILENIEKETVPEIQLVWLEHFMKKVRCPRCGSRLMIKGNTIFCDCGWKVKL
ncbi:MAG: rhomboid family intramembrane serine protease [Methanobacteriota archaeon]|nr:MAG: rhomboid family intramembrane serine protease [Euryarchaeota archaeon]